jgi:hypothetical protein
MMPNPDDILPRAAWTDCSGGTLGDKWSEQLMMLKEKDCARSKEEEEEEEEKLQEQ